VEASRDASRAVGVAMQILSYFVRNPSAADSLEGITQWRLLEEAIHCSLLETSDALQWLLEQGYLAEIAKTRRGSLYRLNPERRHEAELLLQSRGDAEKPKHP